MAIVKILAVVFIIFIIFLVIELSLTDGSQTEYKDKRKVRRNLFWAFRSIHSVDEHINITLNVDVASFGDEVIVTDGVVVLLDKVKQDSKLPNFKTIERLTSDIFNNASRLNIVFNETSLTKQVSKLATGDVFKFARVNEKQLAIEIAVKTYESLFQSLSPLASKEDIGVMASEFTDDICLLGITDKTVVLCDRFTWEMNLYRSITW